MKSLLNPASLVALAWASFQIYMVYGPPLDLIVAVPIHVMFGVVLTFITHPIRKDSTGSFSLARASDYLMAAGAAAIALYYLANAERLVSRIAMVDLLEPADFVVGIATLILVIEAVRRALGMGLTAVILVFLAYQFSGPVLRDLPLLSIIGHGGEPTRMFFETFIDMQVLQTEGVFGIPSIVSYNQVFYFLLFGAFLQLFGGGQLFMDLSMLLVGRFRGGMAKVCYSNQDIGAAIASGSFKTMGMLIAPCSVRSMSEIASGVTSTLLTRAADVILKEHRRLVLMVRETPLHRNHLRTMTELAELGAIIAPPVPAFYARPASLTEMVDHTLGRVLDLFDIELGVVKRWGETSADLPTLDEVEAAAR